MVGVDAVSGNVPIASFTHHGVLGIVQLNDLSSSDRRSARPSVGSQHVGLSDRAIELLDVLGAVEARTQVLSATVRAALRV